MEEKQSGLLDKLINKGELPTTRVEVTIDLTSLVHLLIGIFITALLIMVAYKAINPKK